MKTLFLTLFTGLLTLILTLWSGAPTIELAERDSVEDVLVALGAPPAPHLPDTSLPNVSVAQGQSLVHTGFALNPNGKATNKQSANFVCTSCHNTQREDPDLRFADPEARLNYTIEHGLPFLQGTTLYGAVNRRSFYNGDYQKKYGDLVFTARNDLREAIQLCATECAQGRPLETWELESVLAYLWTIDLKIADLQLPESDRLLVEKALNGQADRAEAVAALQKRYLNYSPATFLDPPRDRAQGYPDLDGRPEKGRLIYENSCLHCHENSRYAFFRLDNARHTFEYLAKHIPRYTRYSLYQVGRYGTSPMPGKRTYMPNYTQEKMSNQQMEDLRAYIEQRTRGGE